ncbi:MAG: hypothetical protein ACI4DN_06995 [Lachnospiraceae bacterium]
MLYEKPEELLSLYEHQSTPNPNIPLRDFFYVSREYEKMVAKESLYSTKRVKEYMLFVERVRKYIQLEDMCLEDAVECAVSECIKEGILSQFLEENRREVITYPDYNLPETMNLILLSLFSIL